MTSKELLNKTKHALHCKYINNQMIADQLGVSRQSISRKLNGNDCRAFEFFRIAKCGDLLSDDAVSALGICISKLGENVKLSKALKYIGNDAEKLFVF